MRSQVNKYSLKENYGNKIKYINVNEFDKKKLDDPLFKQDINHRCMIIIKLFEKRNELLKEKTYCIFLSKN